MAVWVGHVGKKRMYVLYGMVHERKTSLLARMEGKRFHCASLSHTHTLSSLISHRSINVYVELAEFHESETNRRLAVGHSTRRGGHHCIMRREGFAMLRTVFLSASRSKRSREEPNPLSYLQLTLDGFLISDNHH